MPVEPRERGDNGAAVIFRSSEIPWEPVPAENGVPEDQARGVRHRWYARGEGGFYIHDLTFPAEHRVAPHSHDRDEVLLILEGGCTLGDGSVLGAGDAVVLLANNTYGFTVGAEGMRFLNLRAGTASLLFES
jgi:hypothetical protein